MPSITRVAFFGVLVVASLLSGGWIANQAMNNWNSRLALLDPERSNTIDASVIERRLMGKDHDIKYRFQPVDQQASPITSKWVTVPKEVYDSLPESSATLPVAYLKESPQRYDLKFRLEKESYRQERREEAIILSGLAVVFVCLAVPWFFWLCFADAGPLTVSCQLGCLNSSGYDMSSGALTKVMNYQTVPRTYSLARRHSLEEVGCTYCSKPLKVRIASQHEARWPAPGIYCLCFCTGLIVGVLASQFWLACPAWLPPVSIVAGIIGGGIAFRHWWNWPAYHGTITLVEGQGEVVHSKTTDNGSVIKWYEHEVLK